MNTLDLLIQDMDAMIEEAREGHYTSVSGREKVMQDEIYSLREQIRDQQDEMKRQERRHSLYLERIDELSDLLQVADHEKAELQAKLDGVEERERFYKWLYNMEKEYEEFQNDESGTYEDPEALWQEHKRRRLNGLRD